MTTTQLNELNEKFAGTAPEFQNNIRGIAKTARLSVIAVYAMWREYTARCIDQSAVLFEFKQWYADKLKPRELPQGTPVMCNGFRGAIVRFYASTTYEVRVPGGVCATDDFEVIETPVDETPAPADPTAKFLNDIPLDVAMGAHRGTSFTPEKRGHEERADYARTMAADYAMLAKLIEGKPEMLATLDAEFARYRAGYAAKTRTYLHGRSGIMSTMITGPANFPVRRMEKRNNASHRKLEDLIGFRDRALDAIRKTLQPELRPIMAGDSDATTRLETKIAEAEALQERMRDANKAIRKHAKAGPAAQIEALGKLGFSEAVATKLLEPDFCGRIGFADYELTNNGANIRRMKSRLTHVAAAKSAEPTERDGANARIEDVPAENRIRLFFPGKPAAEVRTELKSNGFRWTPTLGCWQAYRNDRAFSTAKKIAA